MPKLLQWGRWKSLRVAKKYVARWDGVPWARGKVPWPIVVPESVGDWRYEWREFKANNLWPPPLVHPGHTLGVVYGRLGS